MTSILKADNIQDADGNNIINENSNTITIGASGDTTNIIGTLQNNGAAVGGTNTPAFFAYQQAGTAQTISSGSFTKLVFGTEIFDTASAYDTSNGRFTPAVAGKYFVFGAVAFSTGTDFSQNECAIYKNGSQQVINISPNDSYSASYVTGIIDMDDNDYVEIYAKHNRGSNLDTLPDNDGKYVRFGAYKLVE